MKTHVEMAKLFIEQGAEVNAQVEINNRSCTPLELAIKVGYVPLYNYC